MKRAFLKVLPATSPGLTAAEIGAAVLPHLPEDLFPQGAKAGWWKKAVQLDLEAKGVDCARRDQTTPLAQAMTKTCSGGGFRTPDPAVNSRLLCH